MTEATMSAQPPASPSGSLTGYSFKVWLRRNKGSLKLLAAAVFAYSATLVTGIKSPELNALAAAAVGVVSKLGLDALDFWLSEVPQP